MAAVTSQIGSLTFVYLRSETMGPLLRLHAEQLLVQRPGVDGTAFILTGIKGQEHIVESFATFSSLANAQAAQATYEAYELLGPQTVIWSGITLTGIQWKVLQVDVTECRKHGAATNGSAAHVRARWRLIAV